MDRTYGGVISKARSPIAPISSDVQPGDNVSVQITIGGASGQNFITMAVR